MSSQLPPNPSLKLSEGRRQLLLAQFKTRSTGQKASALAKPASDLRTYFGTRGGVFWKPSTVRTLAQVAAVAVVLFLAALVSLPNFVRSRNTAQRNSILLNLRQLDGAKQQWALENKKADTDTPTLDDLKPYIKGGGEGWLSVAGEKYELGRVQDDPVAVKKNGERIRLPAEPESSTTTFAFQDKTPSAGTEQGRVQVSGQVAQPPNVQSLNVVGYADAGKAQPGSATPLESEAFRRRYGLDARGTPEIASRVPARPLRAGEPIAEKAPAPSPAAGAVVLRDSPASSECPGDRSCSGTDANRPSFRG